MRTVWFATGDSSWAWDQSYGLSRDERTGRWTLYDHRASEEGIGIYGMDRYATTDALAAALLSDEYGWTPGELMELIAPFTEPSMQELRDDIRRRDA